MAYIEQLHLDDLLVNVDDKEKDYTEFHPDIVEVYERNGYADAPKSKQERDERKLEGGWNGLNSCFDVLEVSKRNGKTILEATLKPARYLVGEAMRDYVSEVESTTERTLSQKEIDERSPDLANISLLIPVELEGKYFVLGQIKGGDTLGGGQIHAAAVAGGVDAKALNYDSPLVETLRNETSEELGMDLSTLGTSSFAYMVNERELGHVNLGAVAKNVKLENVLNSYQNYTTRKILNNAKLEVEGLVLLEVDVENGGFRYENTIAFLPTAEGVEVDQNYSANGLRPFTVALDNFFRKKDNIEYIFGKAGIEVYGG